jgi:glycine/D-amino acid oxidase-like deaminating enzyme
MGSRAAGMRGYGLASGFGGNGINSAALAAKLLTAELTGQPDPEIECFDPYRFNDTQS